MICPRIKLENEEVCFNKCYLTIPKHELKGGPSRVFRINGGTNSSIEFLVWEVSHGNQSREIESGAVEEDGGV